jgi:hypothetical protein
MLWSLKIAAADIFRETTAVEGQAGDGIVHVHSPTWQVINDQATRADIVLTVIADILIRSAYEPRHIFLHRQVF